MRVYKLIVKYIFLMEKYILLVSGKMFREFKIIFDEGEKIG